MSFVAVAVAGVAAAGSIAAASMSSSAAKKASQQQAESADEATALQREQWLQGREDMAPWRDAGQWALPRLQQMLRQGPGQPFRPPAGLDPRQYQFDPNQFAFTPPTAESLVNDPGYQFRLRAGQQALEGSAAARGGLLSGGAMRGLTQFGQELGSQEYQAAYGRALGQNQLGYGRALAGNELRYGRALTANQDQYQRAFQQWQARQGLNTAQYNRLAGLAGVGQQSTQYLGQLGANYATQAGELALQRGNALSQGQVAQGQIWGNAFNQVGSSLGGLGMMYMLRPQTPSPQQAGYNPNTAPYDPWAY